MGAGLFVTHDAEGLEIANIAAMIEARALRQPAAPALIMKEAIVGYRGLQAAGGAKVHFRDVERMLEAHPAIKEAAVFVALDAEGRESMGLAYIAGAAVAPAELQAYARARLGPLCPAHFLALQDLPRTVTSGKVQRDRLTALYLDDGTSGLQR